MSKAGSAAKVKLNSYDDLFGASGIQAGSEQLQDIALSELHEFKGHPFRVLDDEKMQETVESKNIMVSSCPASQGRGQEAAMRSFPDTAGSMAVSWQGFPLCRCLSVITVMMRLP